MRFWKRKNQGEVRARVIPEREKERKRKSEGERSYNFSNILLSFPLSSPHLYGIALRIERRDSEQRIVVAVQRLAKGLRSEIRVRWHPLGPLPDIGHQQAVRVREMVGQVTDVVGVRESDGERGGEIILPLGGPLIAVSIVADVRPRPHPAGPAQLGLRHAEQDRFHAEIELRIRFLAVDNVKRIRQCLHVRHLEIEPLMPGAAVHVRRQDQIVLSHAYL